MWITPSGIPHYNLYEDDLVTVDLETGKTIGRPKTEYRMARSRVCPKIICVDETDKMPRQCQKERLNS